MLTFDSVLANRWAAEQYFRRREAGQTEAAEGFLDGIFGPTLVEIAHATTSQERTVWVDRCLRRVQDARGQLPPGEPMVAAWFDALNDRLIALGYGIADGVPPRCPCGCGHPAGWGAVRTPAADRLVRATELALRGDAWRPVIAARQPTSLPAFDASVQQIWGLRSELALIFHGAADLDVTDAAAPSPEQRLELAGAWMAAISAQPGAPVRELLWQDPAATAAPTHALLTETDVDRGTYFG